jgi:hypothetical protein
MEGFRRLSLLITGLAIAGVLAGPSEAEAQYDPPIGIPAPPFGINESHTRYAGQTFAAGGFVYRDAGNGPYSHYVNRSGGCSDSNAYGTQAAPRCTIPSSLPAGSVVEVHGSGYGGATWNVNGTASNPVFIRGAGANEKPRFNEDLTISGSGYGIVEYLDVSPGRVFLTAQRTALRHSEVHDSTKAGALVLPRASYTVIYANRIHGITGGDKHGVNPSGAIDHIWILNNIIYEAEGDAVQFCHGCIGQGNGPAEVYIGRNTMYSVTTGENAIDIKEARGPVIISENDMYGYKDTSHSNGEALRINDEGNQGDIWVIANRFHDTLHAIQPQNNHSTGVHIIGNIFYNVTGRAIGGSADTVVNNTFYNVGSAIESGTEVRNNIIMNASTHIGNEVGSCSNNLVFQSSGGVSTKSGCAGQTSLNPMFVNAAAGDFRLQSGSPARNSGSASAIYQTFQSKNGRSIAYDFNGVPRPQEGAWDRGATEWDAGGSGGGSGGSGEEGVPAAPSNLQIVR